MDDQSKREQELFEEIRSLRDALKLQSEQTEYQSGLIATAMDAIIATDDAQNIIQFNTAAEKIFGYKSVEIIGKPLQILLPEHFRKHHLKHIQGFGESGVTSRTSQSMGTLSGLRANGEVFPIEISVSQALIKDRKVYFSILRDVSERLKLEELLVNHYDSLNTLHRITLDLLNKRDVQEMLNFIVVKAAHF